MHNPDPVEKMDFPSMWETPVTRYNSPLWTVLLLEYILDVQAWSDLDNSIVVLLRYGKTVTENLVKCTKDLLRTEDAADCPTVPQQFSWIDLCFVSRPSKNSGYWNRPEGKSTLKLMLEGCGSISWIYLSGDSDHLSDDSSLDGSQLELRMEKEILVWVYCNFNWWMCQGK